MKKLLTDWKFIIGYLISDFLIYLSFDHSKVFWYIYTGSILFLISYAIMNEDIEDELPLGQYLLYGILSGLALYALFWVGNTVIEWLDISFFQNQIAKLYSLFAPDYIWHFIVLVLIIVPGEEIFWRGFIQKRLLSYTNFWTSIIVSSLLYSSVFILTGYFSLALAALISGAVWGLLFAWKRSVPLVIISHLTFDLVLFLFLPLV